ncbi:MAG: hypothetical protein WC742_15440 [Gallionellaceae bacterium]|jgi:hypothetical protein
MVTNINIGDIITLRHEIVRGAGVVGIFRGVQGINTATGNVYYGVSLVGREWEINAIDAEDIV